MKKMLFPLLGLLVCTLAPVAQAQPDSAYYGLSVGDFDYAEGAFGDVFDDSVSSWRLMVGFQFMEHLAVEGSYGETSTVRDTLMFTQSFPPPPQTFELGFESEISKILTVRILGTLPFDNGITLMGGLGYLDFEQQIVFSVDGVPQQSGEFNDNIPAYYFGVGYDWDRVGLRLGYEKFDFDGDVDADEISLTFMYKI